MTLRELVEKDIIFLEEIELIAFERETYHENLEDFLDYMIDFISPYTAESLYIGVKK